MSDYDHEQYSLKEANADTQLDKTIQEIVSGLNELNEQLMIMSGYLKILIQQKP